MLYWSRDNAKRRKGIVKTGEIFCLFEVVRETPTFRSFQRNLPDIYQISLKQYTHSCGCGATYI